MATPIFIHGLKGTVSLNGNLFNALTIDFEESTTLEDITYTQAGGATYAVKIPGYISGSGSVNFIYDTANQPTISPYDMRPGRSTPIAFIVYPDGTKPFSCNVWPSALRFTTGPTAGAVKCSMTYESTGAITEPNS